MGYFEDTFSIKTDSEANRNSIVLFDNIRITVLFSRLIRVEYDKSNCFCDEPTQAVWFRNFNAPDFSVYDTANYIRIKTSLSEFFISKLNGKLLKVITQDKKCVTDFKSCNLKGTRRTLDMTYGKVPLGDGIMSRNGVAVLDDSKSLCILDDGTLKPFERQEDYYVFSYSSDYRDALKDYYKITGYTPLLPRFVFGNWWSRYKAYSQNEYLSLMKRFQSEKIPFTVATVDMDWHWVNVVKKFGSEAKYKFPVKNPSELNSGWTGYSWNTDLFPDYKDFLLSLKKMNMHITLNVHPSMGVRFFENQYKEFAEFMDIDPESGKNIKFDLTDKKFAEGYFRFLHHQYEEDGVDFWWIDWQQGSSSQIPGLDPLWLLNHYHFIDSGKNNKRPLILSRYAGAGSHRYPLGFSGDTAVYWSALRFQPYFTLTSSNMGYTWWSHDIGGHRGGKKYDELYLRWVQFGVFSPINRLHSSNNELMGKEPWKFSDEIKQYTVEFLRLRHRLIPYIYTMNYRCHSEGRALIEPMYYEYPSDENAYKCNNQYFFGSELIVAPVTSKRDIHTNNASVDVWLPEGRFTDIFTNRTYTGGKFIKMFRGLASIPVLAKEGSIIPLDTNGIDNDISLPTEMEILVFNGNNSFDLYEDDGETNNYKNNEYSISHYNVFTDDTTLKFSLEVDDKFNIQPERKYVVSFRNISDCKKMTLNGEKIGFSNMNGFVSVKVASKKFEIFVSDYTLIKTSDKKDDYIDAASKYNGLTLYKNIFKSSAVKGKSGFLTPKRLKQQIEEINSQE